MVMISATSESFPTQIKASTLTQAHKILLSYDHGLCNL